MAIWVVCGRQPGEDRGDGRHPGGHRHGHGQRVVDEQGHGRDLGHGEAEVLPGHHVGAAGLGVDLHHLEVREGDEQQHEDHRDGHRDDQRVGRRPDGDDQGDEHLLGGVGRRGDDVRGEDGQGGGLAQALRRLAVRGDGGPEEDVLQPVAQRLGEVHAARRCGDRGSPAPGDDGRGQLGQGPFARPVHGRRDRIHVSGHRWVHPLSKSWASGRAGTGHRRHGGPSSRRGPAGAPDPGGEL